MIKFKRILFINIGLGFLFIQPALAPASSEFLRLYSWQITPITKNLNYNVADLPDLLCQERVIQNIGFNSVLRGWSVKIAPTHLKESEFLVKPFNDEIRQASERHKVDEALLHAVIEVESGYRPNAESPRGAMGLMQLMPATAAQYSLKDPFDPNTNIDTGARHLRKLIDKFGIERGLAAYNAGEGVVHKFGGIPPYPETRNYVSRILKLISNTQQKNKPTKNNS